MCRPTTWYLCCVVLLATIVSACSAPEASQNPYTLSIQEKQQLQTGDIILRRGEGLVSSTIASVLNEQFDVTHCGILVNQPNGQWAVVHALEDEARKIDGIVAQSIDQFVAESRYQSVIVVRYCDADGYQQQLKDLASQYLSQNIPFDKSFDIYDSSRFYCSELLQHIYMDCFGVDIFPVRITLPTTDLLKYSHLFNQQVFHPVLNHQLSELAKR